eukprot:GSA120T00009952001.1
MEDKMNDKIFFKGKKDKFEKADKIILEDHNINVATGATSMAKPQKNEKQQDQFHVDENDPYADFKLDDLDMQQLEACFDTFGLENLDGLETQT